MIWWSHTLNLWCLLIFFVFYLTFWWRSSRRGAWTLDIDAELSIPADAAQSASHNDLVHNFSSPRRGEYKAVDVLSGNARRRCFLQRFCLVFPTFSSRAKALDTTFFPDQLDGSRPSSGAEVVTRLPLLLRLLRRPDFIRLMKRRCNPRSKELREGGKWGFEKVGSRQEKGRQGKFCTT